MSYIRNAPKRNLEALRNQQKVAAAAIEKAEKELAEIEAQEREIIILERRKVAAIRGIQEAKNRVELATRKLAEPPIVWGGRDGLEEAAKESARYDRRRRPLRRLKNMPEISPKASKIGSDNPTEEGVRNGTH